MASHEERLPVQGSGSAGENLAGQGPVGQGPVGQGPAGERIWRRYGGSPGVISTAAMVQLARRADRWGTGRLPLLAAVQGRWMRAGSGPPALPELPYAGPLVLAGRRPLPPGAPDAVARRQVGDQAQSGSLPVVSARPAASTEAWRAPDIPRTGAPGGGSVSRGYVGGLRRQTERGTSGSPWRAQPLGSPVARSPQPAGGGRVSLTGERAVLSTSRALPAAMPVPFAAGGDSEADSARWTPVQRYLNGPAKRVVQSLPATTLPGILQSAGAAGVWAEALAPVGQTGPGRVRVSPIAKSSVPAASPDVTEIGNSLPAVARRVDVSRYPGRPIQRWVQRRIAVPVQAPWVSLARGGGQPSTGRGTAPHSAAQWDKAPSGRDLGAAIVRATPVMPGSDRLLGRTVQRLGNVEGGRGVLAPQFVVARQRPAGSGSDLALPRRSLPVGLQASSRVASETLSFAEGALPVQRAAAQRASPVVVGAGQTGVALSHLESGKDLSRGRYLSRMPLTRVGSRTVERGILRRSDAPGHPEAGRMAIARASFPESRRLGELSAGPGPRAAAHEMPLLRASGSGPVAVGGQGAALASAPVDLVLQSAASDISISLQAETSGSAPSPPEAGPSSSAFAAPETEGPDLERLADEVMAIIEQRLIVQRESIGL